MFKLRRASGPFGDATSCYVVDFDRDYTVREFLKELLQRGRDWGSIDLRLAKELHTCDYCYGKAYGPVPTEWLDKRIKSAAAHGGWSNMDYIVELRGNDLDTEAPDEEKAKIIQALSRVLEQSSAIKPVGMAPMQLTPGVKAYTSAQAICGVTIDFNALATDIYESKIFDKGKEEL